MSDKELADKVVALGVGSLGQKIEPRSYGIGLAYPLYTNEFVRDWRVAGALMEILINKDNPNDYGNYDVQAHHQDGTYWVMIDSNDGWRDEGIRNESLPRAIIEACCEALGERDE